MKYYDIMNEWFIPHTTVELTGPYYGLFREKGFPKMDDSWNYQHCLIASDLQPTGKFAEIQFFKRLMDIANEYKDYTDIYWRRMPELVKEYTYDEDSFMYLMRCRFSLGKIGEVDGKE